MKHALPVLILAGLLLPAAIRASDTDDCQAHCCLLELIKGDANAHLMLPVGAQFPDQYLDGWLKVRTCPKGGQIDVGPVGTFPRCDGHRPISGNDYLGFLERTARQTNLTWAPLAAYQLARDYGYQGNKIYDVAKAIDYCRQSAGQGYAPAQYLLGISYDMGHGVEKDTAQAWKLIQAAADQKYSPAIDALQKRRDADVPASQSPPSRTAPARASERSASERLLEAKKLLDSGLMSQAEYEAARKRILDDL